MRIERMDPNVEVTAKRRTIVTALPLERAARQRLSELLEARVLDVREPCEHPDLVLTPACSPHVIAALGRATLVRMDRVLVLGRGGAGKSVFARTLGARIDAEAIELDKVFWSETLQPLALNEWAERQAVLVEGRRWVMDGDLGPYDILEPRLRRADTVVVLDLPLLLCAWRAWRRGPERRDFWAWTLHWRRDSRQRVLEAVADFAPDADLVVLTNRRAVERWLSHLDM
jgi:adenylate kinase family enzyme